MELGAGNMDRWYTPEGEAYAPILDLDHVIQGHNCCPFTTVQETKMRLRHWDDPSSEAIAMSILPFWEIYHAGEQDAMRIKEGKLRTTGHFKSAINAEQRDTMRKTGALRNRALIEQGIKPDMLKFGKLSRED